MIMNDSGHLLKLPPRRLPGPKNRFWRQGPFLRHVTEYIMIMVGMPQWQYASLGSSAVLYF